MALAIGVSEIKRLAPEPLNTIPVGANSFLLLVTAVTVSEPGAVSRSPTVKGIGELVEFFTIFHGTIGEIVGASFTGATLTSMVRVMVLFTDPLSEMVRVMVAVPD